MRLSLLFVVLWLGIPARAQSPLLEFSAEWNDPKYMVCNTAANANYMSAAEKNVIYILNLARVHPDLFLRTVIRKYVADHRINTEHENYISLVSFVQNREPVKLLMPDSLAYASAQCHAQYSCENNFHGHERYDDCGRKKHYAGECIDFYSTDPIVIVMDMMIDWGLPEAPHRKACFSSRYTSLGVSIRAKEGHTTVAVLDFEDF